MNEEYLNFFLELLQLEIDSNSDRKLVHSFLAQHTDKLDLTFAATAQQWFHSKLDPNDSENDRALARNFNNLAINLKNFPLGSRLNNLEIVIIFYQAALLVYTREAFPEKWAMTQNNLANAYSDRISGERRENLEIAIHSYQAVLQVYTREAFPEQWATTHNNLALAYSDRISGERRENLEIAIRSYQAVLQVYTREAFPEQWATTHNNLALAYSDRISGERRENLEIAITFYQAALLVRTREAFPEQWATTHNNLANVYLYRISGERRENLEQAIRSYQAVLEVYTRDAFPEQWATTQNNLAAAYCIRICGERSENLEIAITFYQEALLVRTREAFPEQWATTQNNLAIAYCIRICGERSENLEIAITFYQAALQVRTREAFPQDWAMTQNNLANAYCNRIKGERSENLEMAIRYFQGALLVRTPEALPLDCLQTGRSLGNLGYDQQNWEIAIFGYDRAIRAVEQSRNWATSPQTKREILEDALPIYGKMIQACIHLERYDTAFLTVERSKSRTLIELLSNADLTPKTATPEQQQRYRQLSREIAALQQSGGEGSVGSVGGDGRGNPPVVAPNFAIAPNSAIAPTLSNQLKDLLQQRDELLAEINDPDFNAIQEIRPQLPDFQQILTPETALIEWYLPYDPNLGGDVFVVTLENNRHKIQTHHYTAEQRQALDEFNQTYFADYSEPTWYDNLTPRLQQLAQLLDFDELLGKIPPTCHSLILVPHLYLHLFPLHGLAAVSPHTSHTPHTPPSSLQNRFPQGIRYAPSCQILEVLQNRRQRETPPSPGTPPNPPLLRGGTGTAPNLPLLRGGTGTRTGQQFFAVQNPTKDLPYAEMEVEFIRENFEPNSYVLKNSDASKAAFNNPETLAKLRESFFVHFSCHGGFDSDNPLNSALILAGDAPPKPKGVKGDRPCLTLRDGRRFDTEHQALTLREIYANLELPACRLVMLAACETGLLSSQVTDEYIGLVSGFLYAGSHSVVSSFWLVDDFATAFLSIRFYQELTPNTTIAKALQAAQIWLQCQTKSDLLAWCEKDLKMSEDEIAEVNYTLADYAPIPFEDMLYWLAFFASGL